MFKNKSEICKFLDQFYLLWMENKDLSFGNLLEGIRKEYNKSNGLSGSFFSISDDNFLSLLREFQNSQRDEKENS